MILPAASQKVDDLTFFPPKGVPRNFIIISCSGLSTAEITAAMIQNKGSLNLEKFPVNGMMKTWSADNLVTDEAAAMTAIATGQKTANGMMGVDKDGKPLKNLMEWAKGHNMRTGMVLSGSLMGTTPLAFSMHVDKVKDPEQTVLGYLDNNIDMLFGGGYSLLMKRKDQRNLEQEFKTKGYEIVEKEKKIGRVNGDKILAVTADDIYRADVRKDYMQKAVKNSVNMLHNSMGYLLLVDFSRPGEAARLNDENYLSQELLDFDKTVGEVYDYLGHDKETLIIVLGKNEEGGLSVTGGDLSTGQTKLKWANKSGTASLVPVFAAGPGSEVFNGFYDNTEIFNKILAYINRRQ
jgi:alkaline phosphatase